MTYAIVALLVLLLDQLTKYLATIHIPLNIGVVELIPGILALRNIHNYGAAFGILKNARWFFLIITVLLFIAAAYAVSKKIIHSKSSCWLAVLVLAGALGNAIDRLIYGYVVDMFQFVFLKHFAIFNVADIFITCGTILFCIVIFREDSETIPATVGTIKQKVTSAVFTLHNKLPFKSAEHITTVAEEMELPVIDDMALDSVAEEVTAVFDAISTETITAIENIVNPTEESHLEDTGVFKPIPEENPFIPFLEEKTTKLSIEETTKFLIKESPAEMSDSVRSPVEAEPLAKEALSAEATSSAFVEPEAETHTAELPEESASDSETRLSKTSSEPEPDKVSASDDAIPFEPAVSMFDDAFHLLSDNDDDETFTLTDILAEFSDKDYEN